MNLFYLAATPTEIAQAHSDQHLAKMVLECAQILCTAVRRHGGWTPYKATHEQHPVCLWAGDTVGNWQFVWETMMALEEERKFRRLTDFSPHASVETMMKHKEAMEKVIVEGCGKERVALLPPAMAMPVEFKVTPDDPINCYRLYYRHCKSRVNGSLATWFLRQKPKWWNRYGIIVPPEPAKGAPKFSDEEEE